jgi:MHS family shikimate/dehydroshikimate transporter-like MFS transporter
MKHSIAIPVDVPSTGTASQPRAYRLAGAASMAGTTIEWYDFFLYGTAAALVFGKIFFPALDPISGVLAAFATYAVGFLGRPLGGSSSAISATGSAASRCCWSR